MVTLFAQFAIFNDKNIVRILNGGETMRDDDDGQVVYMLAVLVDSLLDGTLVELVKC